MYRPLSIFIGLRYIRAKRRNQFISFISLTSMIGLTLGIIAMITVLSVMNGFQKEMTGRILGLVPHGVITATQGMNNWQAVAKKIEQNTQVIGTAPLTSLQGMLSFHGKISPIFINGIDPNEEEKVSTLKQHITYGSFEALTPNSHGIILGEATAGTLGVMVGDSLLLIVPEPSHSVSGITPRMLQVTLVGTFSVGSDLDNTTGFIHLTDAAQIKQWQPNQVGGIRVKLKDLYQAPTTIQTLIKKLNTPSYHGEDWTKTQGSLFSAMKMEKTMIGLLLMIIIAVAAFNIIATLIMVVSDKRLDIAILRTLGATPKQIMALFMIQGTVIGLIGVIAGTGLGVLLTLNVNRVANWIEALSGRQLFSSDIFMINYLPVDMQLSDIAMVCIAALLLSFLATLYPAFRASKTQPAEALRYE